MSVDLLAGWVPLDDHDRSAFYDRECSFVVSTSSLQFRCLKSGAIRGTRIQRAREFIDAGNCLGIDSCNVIAQNHISPVRRRSATCCTPSEEILGKETDSPAHSGEDHLNTEAFSSYLGAEDTTVAADHRGIEL